MLEGEEKRSDIGRSRERRNRRQRVKKRRGKKTWKSGKRR